jgi:hypothetical protein
MMCSCEADLIKPFILYDFNAAPQFHRQKQQILWGGAKCEPVGGGNAGAGMAMCFMRSQARGRGVRLFASIPRIIVRRRRDIFGKKRRCEFHNR